MPKRTPMKPIPAWLTTTAQGKPLCVDLIKEDADAWWSPPERVVPIEIRERGGKSIRERLIDAWPTDGGEVDLDTLLKAAELDDPKPKRAGRKTK